MNATATATLTSDTAISKTGDVLVPGEIYLFRTSSAVDIASAQYSGQYVTFVRVVQKDSFERPVQGGGGYIGTPENRVCEVRTANGHDIFVLANELS